MKLRLSGTKAFFGVLVVLLSIAYLTWGYLTVSDYGLMWDAWEHYMGDRYLAFYTGLSQAPITDTIEPLAIYQRDDHPHWDKVIDFLKGNDVAEDPLLIWPLGPMVGALSKRVFWQWLGWFDFQDATHFGVIMVIGLFLPWLYLFAARRIGRWGGIMAVLWVSLHPRFFAHAHFNVKDPVEAVFFTGCIMMFLLAVERRSYQWMLGGGLMWGLALATKANALFVPVILAPWFCMLLWRRRKLGEAMLTRNAWVALAVAPIFGISLMILLWPLMLVNLPSSLHTYIASLLSRGGGGTTGWQIWPFLHFIGTMPVAMLLLLLIGLSEMGWRSWRKRRIRPFDLLLISWLIIPILRVSLPGAKDFDGIRHWLEVIPAAALIAGLGFQRIMRLILLITRRSPKVYAKRLLVGLLLALLFIQPAYSWIVANHPYQLVYFSPLVGRASGAERLGFHDATDYWANSYALGFDWINEHTEHGAVVLVGVAPHLTWFNREIRMRADLNPLPTIGYAPEDVHNMIREHSQVAYLMYVTRKGWYEQIVRTYQPISPVVHEVAVDGQVILLILRIDASQDLPPENQDISP